MRIPRLPWLLTTVLALAWGWSLWSGSVPAGVHTAWLTRQEMLNLSGLCAIGLMSLAMFLATRPAWLERPLGGMDRVYRAHKWAGILGGCFALLHWGSEMADDVIKSLVGRAGRLPREEIPRWLDGLRDAGEDLGEWGIYLLLGMLVITLWRRFPYRSWRFLHRAMPLIYLVLAFHAVVLAPLTYWQQPAGLLLGALVLAGSYGALRALLGNIGRRHRVTGQLLAVDRPSPDILAVRCSLPAAWPAHHPGQFAFVSFNRREGAHPFTIASAAREDRSIEFRIKALGDYTRRLPAELHIGQPVSIEGPYGCFAADRLDPQARQQWVAGGIGITPFLAWLEHFRQHPAQVPSADLHYCTADREADPIVAELQSACQALPSIRLQVHGARQGERLQPSSLFDGSPAARNELWFCGPAGLGELLRQALPGTGWRMHQEAFEMR